MSKIQSARPRRRSSRSVAVRLPSCPAGLRPRVRGDGKQRFQFAEESGQSLSRGLILGCREEGVRRVLAYQELFHKRRLAHGSATAYRDRLAAAGLGDIAQPFAEPANLGLAADKPGQVLMPCSGF